MPRVPVLERRTRIDRDEKENGVYGQWTEWYFSYGTEV